MRRAALALALLAVLAVPLVPAVAASPQPRPVCGFCGDPFERAADDAGVNATVEASTATVRVHENGSATWTVENRLANGSDQFAADPETLAAVGRSLARSHRGVAEDPRFVDADLDGTTAVLTFRDPGAAERHAGLLVVDYLHHAGASRWHYVNAERVTLAGPSGTVVANDPESGAVDGGTVIWRGATGDLYASPDVTGYPLVVFGPDRSPWTTARATVAVTLATAPVAISAAWRVLVLQTLVFAATLLAVGHAVRRRRPPLDGRTLGALVAGLGVLAGAAFGLLGGLAAAPVPTATGLVVGGLAATTRGRSLPTTPGRQALLSVGTVAAAGVAVTGLLAATGADDDAVLLARRSAAVVLPAAALLPVGGALDAGDRRRLGWTAVGVVGFVAAVPLLVNLAEPRFGPGLLVLAVGTLLAALFLPVVASPVLALGWRLSARDGGDDGSRGPDDV